MNVIAIEQTAAIPRRAEPARPVKATLAGLSICMLLPSLGASVVNAALPTLAGVFNASFQKVQWLVLAYLLASTALIVSIGRLGDLTGRRRLLLAGIAVFTAASVLGGFAPTLWVLIGARALQGLGAAAMLALAMALVGEAVPKAQTGRAMGLLGTMSAVGTALGPSLGGVLVAALGWRSLFLLHVPLGVLAFLLARGCLPADCPKPGGGAIQWNRLGTALLALTLTAYALAMTVGSRRFGRLNLALLLVVGLGAILFIQAEMRAASPLIQWTVIRDPRLRVSLVTSGLISTVMMTTLVVGPFYLSRALALDPASVGLVLSVGRLTVVLMGVPSGRMADRYGPDRMTMVGLTSIGVGALALSIIPTTLGVPGYLAPLVIMTGGYALFQTANNTAVMTGILPDQRGVISALLNLSRNLGLITGASLMGTVFAVASAATDVVTAPPEAVAVGMRITFALAAMLIMIALLLRHGHSRPESCAPAATRL